MAVPKKRTSKSRRNMRRAHHSIVAVQATECTNCGEPKLTHHMCGKCGHYRGRAVVVKASQV